jgi:hypothetical protein
MLCCGCEPPSRGHKDGPPPQAKRPASEKQPTADAEAGVDGKAKPAAEVKKTLLGKDVWLETQGEQRRVLVATKVCLREGGLECLLCRANTKDYESILSTEADAQVIHVALLAARANPGSPVKYVEKGDDVTILTPSGDRIKILLQYEDKGKLVKLPAQQWILNSKTKKDLDADWVFAGSKLFPNPDDEKKKPVFAATAEGGYIYILNSPSALLDLPLNNPNKEPELRELLPHTARIPALGTKVTIILEPQHEDKKDKK